MRGKEMKQNGVLGVYIVIHILFVLIQIMVSPYYGDGQTHLLAGTPFSSFADDAQQSSQDGSGVLSWMSSGLDWADKIGDTIKGTVLLEYAFLDVFPYWVVMSVRIVAVLSWIPLGRSLHSYIPYGRFWLILGVGVAALVITGLVRTDA